MDGSGHAGRRCLFAGLFGLGSSQLCLLLGKPGLSFGPCPGFTLGLFLELGALLYGRQLVMALGFRLACAACAGSRIEGRATGAAGAAGGATGSSTTGASTTGASYRLDLDFDDGFRLQNYHRRGRWYRLNLLFLDQQRHLGSDNSRLVLRRLLAASSAASRLTNTRFLRTST